ncbi:ATP-binding protein [Gordonia phosphorivorans]|uniref:Signal transduction histidine-protein kinase/phosphatase MprB n=1 Tax=Gordonia phosphorivorans TaxID=1056982 RepID=A0ABV6HAT2_9ACTN
MRQQLVRAMLVTMAALAVLLGVPLTTLTWTGISLNAHEDLADRLKSISEYVLTEETAGRLVGPDKLELDDFRLLVPGNGTLTLVGPSGAEEIGRPAARDQVSESVTLGPGYLLTLSVPRSDVRSRQWLAVGVLVVVILVTLAVGVLVAFVTALRLTRPLRQVATRATAMARGDLSSPWPYYGIDELDRVTTALSEANTAVLRRLEREGQVIGDASHQLRSRLTAIHLRLDELTLHPDPHVVNEAEEAMDLVENLAADLDEFVAASRADDGERTAVAVPEVVRGLAEDLESTFTAADRRIDVRIDGVPRPVSGRPGRLREALSVLLDNALRHGSGTVTVRVEDLASADVVRITVSDEGDGVPDELVGEIFRRGVSGTSSSGVGLSLARALTEADGGRLDLASRRPAVFTIVVPARSENCGADSALRRGPVPHR